MFDWFKKNEATADKRLSLTELSQRWGISDLNTVKLIADTNCMSAADFMRFYLIGGNYPPSFPMHSGYLLSAVEKYERGIDAKLRTAEIVKEAKRLDAESKKVGK